MVSEHWKTFRSSPTPITELSTVRNFPLVMECTFKLICIIRGYTSYMKAVLLMPTWKHLLSRDILHFTLAIPTPGSSLQF